MEKIVKGGLKPQMNTDKHGWEKRKVRTIGHGPPRRVCDVPCPYGETTSVAGGGGGSVAEVAPGVDGRVVDADFVVEVRAGGAAALTFVADDVAALDFGAGFDVEAGEMGVPGGDARAVVDDDNAAVAWADISFFDDAVAGGADFVTKMGSNVEAGVEGAFTAERVEAFTKVTGDAARNWPERGDDGNAGQLARRQEPDSGGGCGHGGDVVLKIAEFVDGTLEVDVGLGGGVGEAEGGLAETGDPVGHGDFASQGLQRVEALVRVFYFGLQLLVLLLEAVLLVAKGVVAAGLPKHSGVGADGGGYGNAANNSQRRYAMEEVAGQAHTSHAARGARSNEKRIMLALHRLIFCRINLSAG